MQRKENLYVCGYPAYQSCERWVAKQYRGDKEDEEKEKSKAYNEVMMSAFFGGEKKVISQVCFFYTSIQLTAC